MPRLRLSPCLVTLQLFPTHPRPQFPHLFTGMAGATVTPTLGPGRHKGSCASEGKPWPSQRWEAMGVLELGMICATCQGTPFLGREPGSNPTPIFPATWLQGAAITTDCPKRNGHGGGSDSANLPASACPGGSGTAQPGPERQPPPPQPVTCLCPELPVLACTLARQDRGHSYPQCRGPQSPGLNCGEGLPGTQRQGPKNGLGSPRATGLWPRTCCREGTKWARP